MILFAEDWALYPTAIVNLQTTNKSFIRLASVYRTMGIKNHAFLLALVNPTLVGIDPFSPDLTMEQMGAIAIECQINPWFYFREVARVPAIAGVGAGMFEANRGNIAAFWCFFNHVMFIWIQIRQTGKSFGTDTLMTLLLNILCQNTSINLLTKDDNLRRENIERMKEIAAELPKYLNQRTRDDANNTEEITIRSLNNAYKAHVPQASAKRAYNMGRGLTTPIFHIDEGPFQPNISIALPAALAATGAAVDRAKAVGAPYGTIITTTAGKKDDKDGKFVYNLLCEAAIWTEKFFDCENAEDFEKVVRRNSRSAAGSTGGVFRINLTMNHQQLGRTDAWLREKIDASVQKGEDAARDYLNQWTAGNQTSPLPVHILEMISKSYSSELYTDISRPHGYITRWYIPEEEINQRMQTSQFILGMDTSEAGGGDDISLFILDVETLETIAVGTYNETNLITFSEWVCSILVTYPNITAIIERRSTGAMLLDYLLLMLPTFGIDPFKRLYNTVVNDFEEQRERWKEIQVPMGRRAPDIYVRYKKCFGFATSATGATSRTELYSTTLQNATKRAGNKVRDKSTIDQILGLVIRNGRVDHEKDAHDDLVVGWLLCHWMLTLAKNLSWYGIDSRRVMSDIGPKVLETPQDMRNRIQQQMVRERIEAIYNELTDEADDFVTMRLEHELRTLDRQIVLEQGEVYSVDALIRQAQETKRNKKRNYNFQQTATNYGYANSNAVSMAAQGVMSDRPMRTSELIKFS